jgi:DNA helicase HerA-like ATPase
LLFLLLYEADVRADISMRRQGMEKILIGKGERPVQLLAKYGNRHGLIAGATGTGKTISLMVLAEGFSRMGVPVFMADVKGDVAGLAMPGVASEKLLERVAEIGMEGYASEACPVLFWDIFGQAGHPVRTTISEIGPSLLARILKINDTQAGMLEIAFTLADDQGLLLLDIDDLRALLGFLADNRKEISEKYGLVSAQSVAAVQRALLSLEREGGEAMFGEPALEINDLLRTDLSGRGIISILAADKLSLKPRLYSSFLLWLLSELFENLPEVGDLDKPKLVFFFDEATSCLTTLRQCCVSGWNRSSGSSAPREWESIFARSFLMTCRMKFWDSLAIASSMPSGPTRPAIRRQ